MNAVILVGGGGTRLRPLTYALPKPLIPVLNRPLISHLIANLRRGGVDRVVLATAASDARIEAALGDGSDLGVAISFSAEEKPLGSGLAVKQAARGFDESFLVCNGDVITDVDVGAMTALHRECGAILSISLAPVADPSSYGIAELGDGDRITRFVEKPPAGEAKSRWANAGTWLFDPALLDHIPDERMDGSLERVVFPSLIAAGHVVQGFRSEGYWMDVGTSERYLQLHHDLLRGEIPAWLPAAIAAGQPSLGEGCEVGPEAAIGARVILGANCHVGRLAHIDGPSVLGDGCVLGERAVVAGSVCWADVMVGAGAVVRESVLGRGCLVGDDAVVEGAVLADGARVERKVRLAPGARLEPGEVVGKQ